MQLADRYQLDFDNHAFMQRHTTSALVLLLLLEHMTARFTLAVINNAHIQLLNVAYISWRALLLQRLA